MPLWVGILWKSSGLGAKEQTKVRGNYVCCLVIICGTWRSKEVAKGFLNLSYGGKGKSHKKEELLWGAINKLPKELTTELLYLELTTISVFCGVKRYMYYMSKEVCINFSSWTYFYLDYWFFINLKITTEWAFAFLNIAVIVFCLIYSLNIPHQNPSFFPVWFYHCHGRRNYILPAVIM